MKTLLHTIIFLLFSISVAKSQIGLIGDAVKVPGHPRILLLRNEENELMKNLEKDAPLKVIHDQIISECNKLIKTPPVKQIKIGKRLLDKSREALKRIFYLSYAWRTTHDPRFLKRDEEELLAVSAFTDWNPSHYLDVAEMTMAVSIGYDWLYNDLDADTRNTIKTAIIVKGLKPSFDSQYNGWLQRTNNWNQVCNAGMTFGALAVYESEPELAKNVINRAISSIKLSMTEYGPNGVYPEGYNYWNYGTNYNVMFLAAIEKIWHQDFGLSNIKGFLQTAGFMENMTGPSGEGFNYSDSGTKPEIQPDPAMFWFAAKLRDPSLLWVEKTHLSASAFNDNVKNRFLPAVLIFGKDMNTASIFAPKTMVWKGDGKNPVALMRTSWTDTNAIYVALKGGQADISHGHMDVGSFIIEAEGVRWAMDFGAENYTNIEAQGIDLFNNKQNSARWQIFRYNNLAHNTLAFSNGLQLVDGFAPIVKCSKQPENMFAITDLTTVYKNQAKKVKRGVAIINKQYVAVKDEIQLLSDTTKVRWTMVTPAVVKILSGNTAELTKDGKKLLLKVLEPNNISLRTWSTVSPHSYESSNKGTEMIGFETTSSPVTNCNITVLLIPEKSVKVPPIPLKPLDNWNAK